MGLLALVATLFCGGSAQAVIPFDPGLLGREVLGNPGAPPVVPAPNIFPLPPPPVREPGFVPAPAGPGPLTFPVPAPGGGVQDGKGSGPTVPPPVQVDADKPVAETGPTDDHEPVGKLSKTDPKYLKRQGVDPHKLKRANDMDSGFDLYLDQVGNVFGVAKGADPKYGEWLARINRR